MENTIRTVSLRLVTGEKFQWEGKIATPADVYRLLKYHMPNMILSEKEMVVVIGLAIDNTPHLLSVVSIGTSRSTFNSPAEIFKLLLTAACDRFIVVHNHPSGNLNFSDKDKENAIRLKNAADILDIEFLDSIVITQDGFIAWTSVQEQMENIYPDLSELEDSVNDCTEIDKKPPQEEKNL